MIFSSARQRPALAPAAPAITQRQFYTICPASISIRLGSVLAQSGSAVGQPAQNDGDVIALMKFTGHGAAIVHRAMPRQRDARLRSGDPTALVWGRLRALRRQSAWG